MNAIQDALTNQTLAPSLKILLVLTLLGILPALILATTSFVRIIVVLSFIRQGIGTAQSPPSQVLLGLALFLTAFSMSPVLAEMKHVAYEPYAAGQIGDLEAMTRAQHHLGEVGSGASACSSPCPLSSFPSSRLPFKWESSSCYRF